MEETKKKILYGFGGIIIFIAILGILNVILAASPDSPFVVKSGWSETYMLQNNGTIQLIPNGAQVCNETVNNGSIYYNGSVFFSCNGVGWTDINGAGAEADPVWTAAMGDYLLIATQQDSDTAINNTIGQKAFPGTCTGNQAVQNTTTTGVQCTTTITTETDPVWVSQMGNYLTKSAQSDTDTAINSTISNVIGNVSNVNSTANLKAFPGVCTGSNVVQNTTTSGVQCIAMSITETEPAYLGNISALQSNITNVNATANLKINQSSLDAEITSRVNNDSNINATANLKALPGVCTGTSVVQNTSTSGVQCKSVVATETDPVWTGDKGSYLTITSQSSSDTAINSTISSVISNVSNVNATANLKALPGTCQGSQVPQNTTTSGVQCKTIIATETDTIAETSDTAQNNTINSVISNVSNINATANLKSLPGTCQGTQIVQNTTISGVQCIETPAGTETDPTFRANLTGILGNITALSANVTNVNSTANLKALPGTASCTGNTYPQNITTTTTGTTSQCFAPTGTDTGWIGNNTGVWANITWAGANATSLGNWSADKTSIQNNISNANDTANLKINQTTYDTLYNYAHSLSNGTSNLTSYTQNYTTQIGFNATGASTQLNLQQTGAANLTATFSQNITGSGTIGKIPVWNSATNLITDSFWHNITTNNVCVNCTSASQDLVNAFTVMGAANITGNTSITENVTNVKKIVFSNGFCIGAC